jgi:hypothetical protein
MSTDLARAQAVLQQRADLPLTAELSACLTRAAPPSQAAIAVAARLVCFDFSLTRSEPPAAASPGVAPLARELVALAQRCALEAEHQENVDALENARTYALAGRWLRHAAALVDAA